jgi:hypothetical protein
MIVARGRAVLAADSDRARNLSLAAALRLLKARPSDKSSKKTPRRASAPALLARAWNRASPRERTQFLHDIGSAALLEALPPVFKLELEHRLKGGDLTPAREGEVATGEIPPRHLRH